jgi:hypothetical protein
VFFSLEEKNIIKCEKKNIFGEVLSYFLAKLEGILDPDPCSEYGFDAAMQSILVPTRFQPFVRRTVFVHSSEGVVGYGVPRVAQLHSLGPGSQES